MELFFAILMLAVGYMIGRYTSKVELEEARNTNLEQAKLYTIEHARTRRAATMNAYAYNTVLREQIGHMNRACLRYKRRLDKMREDLRIAVDLRRLAEVRIRELSNNTDVPTAALTGSVAGEVTGYNHSDSAADRAPLV